MFIKILLRWIMGGSLTSAIVAHDWYYAHKIVSISAGTIAFLLAILFFHLLVFLEFAEVIELNNPYAKKLIFWFRLWLLALVFGISIAEVFTNGEFNNRLGVLYAMVRMQVSSSIIIFPEFIFRIIFSFKQKLKKGQSRSHNK